MFIPTPVQDFKLDYRSVAYQSKLDIRALKRQRNVTDELGFQVCLAVKLGQ